MRKQKSVRDWLMLAALIVFWGSSFALTTTAVADISPLWVMALRLLFGALLLYALMRRAGHSLPLDRPALAWFAWLGLIGSVVPFFLLSWGALHIPSGLIGITMALVPLFTLALARLFLPDERPSLARLAGFLIGFAGLVVLIGPQFVLGIEFAGKPFLAQLCAILATFAYALQLVTARHAPDMPFLVKSTGVLIAATLGGVLLALFFDPGGLAQTSPAALAAIIVLGIFPTGLAAPLLFSLIERAGASFVSLSNYLISPFAYFLGVLMLAEPFEPRALAGLAIILCGIYIAEQRG